MDYFSGINIITAGNHLKSNKMMHRKFLDYWGIQYNHSGDFMVSIDNGPSKIIKGPCVLLNRPGFFYLYGAPKARSRHHCFVCFNGPKIEKMSPCSQSSPPFVAAAGQAGRPTAEENRRN